MSGDEIMQRPGVRASDTKRVQQRKAYEDAREKSGGQPAHPIFDRVTLDCQPDAEAIRAECRSFEPSPSALVRAGVQGWHQFTASVVVHRGKLVASMRVTNVACGPTVNFLGELSSDWRFDAARPVRDLTPNPTLYYEDCRLISRGDRLQMSGTALDRCRETLDLNRIRIAVLDVNSDGDLEDCHVQQSDRYEKNWMPIVTGDELRFVYAVEPVTMMLRYDDKLHHTVPSADKMPRVRGALRGGSQLVPYEGGYLCVVHQVYPGVRYAQRFVRFDHFVQVTGVSRPFFFHSVDHPECCAGLAHWQGRMVLAYGVDKLHSVMTGKGQHLRSSANVAIVTHETIRELFNVDTDA